MRRTSMERNGGVARLETTKPTATGLVRIYKDAATRNNPCTARLLVARGVQGIGRNGRITEVVHVIGGVKRLLYTGSGGCAARGASSTLIMSTPDEENSRKDNKQVFQRLFHTKLVSRATSHGAKRGTMGRKGGLHNNLY